jgi:hypothetical protein
MKQLAKELASNAIKKICSNPYALASFKPKASQNVFLL